MTASDISSIALTIVTIQVGCDLWFNWRVYNTESYRRALNALERANVKLQREREVMEKEQEKALLSTAATSKQAQKNSDRWKKRWQRAQDDHAEAVALVAQRHTAPNIYTSILFVLLMRILGTEHSGKVLGVLPFSVPFAFFRRFVTSRGLQFHVSDDDELTTLTTQACSFFFIYFLCGLSVKFYASKLIGVQPPKGAEGLNAIMQSPQGRKLARSMGVDPDELKNA